MPTAMEQDIVEIPQLAAQWARVRGRLQQEFGEVEYRTWLRQMTLIGLDGDEVTVHNKNWPSAALCQLPRIVASAAPNVYCMHNRADSWALEIV